MQTRPYTCPHCAAVVQYGQTPCPRCGGAIGWQQTPPPPVVVVQPARGPNAGLIILAVIGGLVVLGCAAVFALGGLASLGTRTVATHAAATQAALPPEAPVTLSGTATQNTAPFSLQGGTYRLDWVCTNVTRFQTNFIADLRTTDGSFAHLVPVANVIVPAQIQQTGATNAYNVAAGPYYVAVVAESGDWTVTVTQVR